MRCLIAAIPPLALLVACSWLARADDPARSEPRAEAVRSANSLRLAREEAARYRLELEGAPGANAVLQPDLLLQWSNPVAGSVHGAVFVWTDRGCPVALGSIYYNFTSTMPHLGIEMNTLAASLQSAEREGRPVWMPRGAAPARKPIAKAPKPADTPAGRLRQLRALAAEHSATETTRPDKTGQTITRELRLLTQPIYRYQSTDPDVIDGGLFTFVEGTDPEIFLAIEARRTPTGPEWQFAAVRVNSLTLDLKHKGVAVWSAPLISWDAAQDHSKPYTLLMYYPDPGV